MPEGRRYFFFGITVSEVAFILFFVLLLFTFIQVQSLERENDDSQKEIEKYKNTALESQEKLKKVEEILGVNPLLNPDDPITQLIQAGDALEELSRRQSRIEELEQENDKLIRENKKAREEVSEQQILRETLEGQVKNVIKRAGVGLPPCWAKIDGEIEYLFRITLFGDESVFLAKEAPPSREEEYQQLPSIPDITDTRLPMGEFERLALPIYQDGIERRPSCRYFVKVEFADREACRLLLITERYFYKIVEANDSTICTG